MWNGTYKQHNMWIIYETIRCCNIHICVGAFAARDPTIEGLFSVTLFCFSCLIRKGNLSLFVFHKHVSTYRAAIEINFKHSFIYFMTYPSLPVGIKYGKEEREIFRTLDICFDLSGLSTEVWATFFSWLRRVNIILF
jgi:hypothetical protein